MSQNCSSVQDLLAAVARVQSLLDGIDAKDQAFRAQRAEPRRTEALPQGVTVETDRETGLRVHIYKTHTGRTIRIADPTPFLQSEDPRKVPGFRAYGAPDTGYVPLREAPSFRYYGEEPTPKTVSVEERKGFRQYGNAPAPVAPKAPAGFHFYKGV